MFTFYENGQPPRQSCFREVYAFIWRVMSTIHASEFVAQYSLLLLNDIMEHSTAQLQISSTVAVGYEAQE